MSTEQLALPVNPPLQSAPELVTAVQEYRLATLGAPAVAKIAELHRVERFLEYFDLFNSSSGLPYHNMYHSHCVALNSYEGAWHEGLNESQLRVAFVSGLFHDTDHSGGALPDSANIELALKALNLAQRYAVAAHQGLTDTELAEAISTIKITKYPYDMSPATPLELIIRDADLMQAYEPDEDRLLKQHLGLKLEVERQHNREFPMRIFASLVVSFLDDKAAWNTAWATEKAKKLDWNNLKVRLGNLLAEAR